MSRLIDVDALRKAVNDFFDNSFEGLVSSDLIKYAQAVDDIIDNAPTVDTTFIEVVAYECGKKSVEERPKGKWEYTRNGIFYCNQCNHYLGFKGNFCPNCGLDMRGEEDV